MDDNAAKKEEQVNQEASSKDMYVATLAEIRKMIPQDKFQPKENKSGITWFGPNKTRLLKMVESKRGVRIEFNVPVKAVEGLTILTEDEAKDKHMGTCRWIYSGRNSEVIKQLVEEAIKSFEPKKRADSIEEQNKKDAAKAEAKTPEAEAGAAESKVAVSKEPAAPNVQPQAGRRLSGDEIKQLGGKPDHKPEQPKK